MIASATIVGRESVTETRPNKTLQIGVGSAAAGTNLPR